MPTIAPIDPKISEETENALDSQSMGIAPPMVEPTPINIQIIAFEFIVLFLFFDVFFILAHVKTF